VTGLFDAGGFVVDGSVVGGFVVETKLTVFSGMVRTLTIFSLGVRDEKDKC
jgi:hypothetical protein